MFVKRRINPEKLRAARIAAGFFTITSLMEALTDAAEKNNEPVIVSRPTYSKWESTSGKRSFAAITVFDYNTIHTICDHLKTTPEAVTDPIQYVPEEEKK